MTRMRECMLAAAVAVLLPAAGCGRTDAPRSGPDAAAGGSASTDAAPSQPGDGAVGAAADGKVAGEEGGKAMLAAPSWMPADWDRNAFRGDAYGGGMGGFALQPELVRQLRQEMQLTTPFTLWAVAHDSLIDERFEPVWVWWTALRSCERGIQMSEDLAGEFGDRGRGKAALATARKELQAYAATQPAEITLHFLANLGTWNDRTGNFPLVTGVHHNASTIDAREVERVVDPLAIQGANVEMGSDADGNWTLQRIQASLSDVACVTADGQKLYRFPRQSQWFVVFGDAERGMGGLVDYRARAQVPAPNMTREQAASFSQRNPERKVMVSLTFGPGGPGFVVGASNSAVRAALRKAAVIDAIDGTTLASKVY